MFLDAFFPRLHSRHFFKNMDNEKPFSSKKRKSGSFKRQSCLEFDSGKRKRHNSSHDYSYLPAPSKPIETIYRILCPIKKIGSVLGKGGEIVNALRDETHAKIRVADAIPGAEERVIIIFSYVQQETKGFDDDENSENVDLMEGEHEDLQPHCPAQHAFLKVHDRIAADEVLRGGLIHENSEVNDVVMARILVPSNQVGCLLGKGGTVIQKLRSNTSANIRILPAEQLPPCSMSTDELVQISGMPAIVKKALHEISTLLHQHPHKENPPLDDLIFASTQGGAPMPSSAFQGNPMWSHQSPGVHAPPSMPWFDRYRNEPSGYGTGSFSGSRFGNDGEAVDEFSIRMLCRTQKIGGVIGKGGANIRQLEQQTGACIQVEDTGAGAEERIIVVSSKEASWDPHSPTIEAVLQLLGRTSATSEKGAMTTRLLVPSRKVGCLLGQGGNIITEMRRRTRADIRVYSKDDKPRYTSANEELVQISGNHGVVHEVLAEIASRLRERTLRDDNARQSPVPTLPFQGFPALESIPGRGLSPFGIVGAGNPIRYEHLKVSFGAGNPIRYEHLKSAAQAHEPRGYPGSTIPTQTYSGPWTPAAQGYLGPTTAISQGYLGQPTATGQGYPGPEAPGYPGPPTAAGYAKMNNSVEVKIPSSAEPSILGASWGNISDIRQGYHSRYLEKE